MKKNILFMAMLCLAVAVYSQSFTPRDGVAYNVNLDKWIRDGDDVTAKIGERLKFSIVFNSGYTDFTFGVAMGSGTVRIYTDGSMELLRKALFSRPSVYATGTGTVERSGKYVKITFQTADGEVNEIGVTIQ